MILAEPKPYWLDLRFSVSSFFVTGTDAITFFYPLFVMANLSTTTLSSDQQLDSTEAVGPEGTDSSTGTAALASNEESWKHLSTPVSPTADVGVAPAQATRTNTIAAAEHTATLRPSPENFLELSLAYHNAGRYHDCITAARQALRLRPNYAEAYNNVAAGYQGLHEWDSAIDALRQALRIKPNYSLAKNNLALSQSQKRKLNKA